MRRERWTPATPAANGRDSADSNQSGTGRTHTREFEPGRRCTVVSRSPPQACERTWTGPSWWRPQRRARPAMSISRAVAGPIRSAKSPRPVCSSIQGSAAAVTKVVTGAGAGLSTRRTAEAVSPSAQVSSAASNRACGARSGRSRSSRAVPRAKGAASSARSTRPKATAAMRQQAAMTTARVRAGVRRHSTGLSGARCSGVRALSVRSRSAGSAARLIAGAVRRASGPARTAAPRRRGRCRRPRRRGRCGASTVRGAA